MRSKIYSYGAAQPAKPKKDVKGVILSGSPSSLHRKNPPMPDRKLFNWNVPILGICYGMQAMAKLPGGEITRANKREYGETSLKILKKDSIFSGIPDTINVWMSHYDTVKKPPSGFTVLARTKNIPVAAMVDRKKNFYGLQFHPEVSHTQMGKKILSNFLFKVSKCSKDWNFSDWINSEIQRIKKEVSTGKVLMALSGGVDSSVASVLIQRALGKRFYPVFVDHGLTGAGDIRRIKDVLIKQMGLRVRMLNEGSRFLRCLKGVRSPEKKRKIIGREFINVFLEEARKISGITHLAQGTIYPDIIESAADGENSCKIKTHHNVGGLPASLKLKILEPLKMFYKDEVREIGRKLGIPEELIKQHPFPGPGFGIRIIGAVNKERVDILRKADEIITDELKKSGIYYNLWQAFAVFLPVKTVGVMGDKRTHKNVIAIRCTESKDAMTANWAHIPHSVLGKISTRIVNEINQINRVVYDLTNKPPGTIEWE